MYLNCQVIQHHKQYYFSFNFQINRTQHVYNHSMNGWSQVITGVEFNRTTATQSATSRYTSNLTHTITKRKKH